jgi:hypothetical protein
VLVLDPLVRRHRIDGNISGEVAPLLGYLRDVHRRYHVAIVLVHHARKGGSRMRAGQGVRAEPGKRRRFDYEYVRNGTAYVFMFVDVESTVAAREGDRPVNVHRLRRVHARPRRARRTSDLVKRCRSRTRRASG